MGDGATARVRRTQQERRDETRRALLDATVEALTELGYARTTTLEVQRRSGLSRGALLHHFPSKAELMVEAVHYMAELRGEELRRRATELPEGGDRVDRVLDSLWETFSGPLFSVSLDLRVAARTDPELRAPSPRRSVRCAARSCGSRVSSSARTSRRIPSSTAPSSWPSTS